MKTFSEKVAALRAHHEALLSRKNEPVEWGSEEDNVRQVSADLDFLNTFAQHPLWQRLCQGFQGG